MRHEFEYRWGWTNHPRVEPEQSEWASGDDFPAEVKIEGETIDLNAEDGYINFEDLELTKAGYARFPHGIKTKYTTGGDNPTSGYGRRYSKLVVYAPKSAVLVFRDTKNEEIKDE